MQRKWWGPAAERTPCGGLVSLLGDGLNGLRILDFCLEGEGGLLSETLEQERGSRVCVHETLEIAVASTHVVPFLAPISLPDGRNSNSSAFPHPLPPPPPPLALDPASK